MFSQDDQNNDFYYEWIWVMEFDELYEPTNPFFKLFSQSQGEYMLKPSQSIIDQWDEQVQYNGFPGDFRGNTGSYQTDKNGLNPEITKYTSEYDILSPFDFSGKFMLMRAGLLNLRYCEAANREGFHELAYHLTNDGMPGYHPIPDTMYYAGADVSSFNRTLEPFPFDFDGLSSESYHIPSMARGLHYRMGGVRGRVSLSNVDIPADADSLTFIEEMIMDETAMEMAFEGNRWGDLVRMAMRTNDPAYLADRIYDKLQKGGYAEADEVRTKLLNGDWFLPLPE